LEELRAFLSSILVKPVKTRKVADWLRSVTSPRLKPSAPVATKAEME